jgi:GGDEF domain-containing protein
VYADKVFRIRGAVHDITERKATEEQITKLAFYDPLTQLPNRRLLMDRLALALAASSRHQRKGALLFVDLDDFKSLNDTLGHDKGDLLLTLVAHRLTTCVREGDTVARLSPQHPQVQIGIVYQWGEPKPSQAGADRGCFGHQH